MISNTSFAGIGHGRAAFDQVVSGRVARAALGLVLAVGLAVTLALACSVQEAQASATNVENPRISSGVTTWDCVWFGSYPQTEVAATTALSNASWDTNGDATVDGVRYHRLKKADAIYAGTGTSDRYDWTGKTVAYFKYEPIKWRMLELDGTKALLVSDVGLDDQRYNLSEDDVTWAKCTMRSWLNGYGSSKNVCETSYSGKGFLQKAFSSSERDDIVSKSLTNADNIKYGTEGGSKTTDKVFLLAESDVWSSSRASLHGFSKKWNGNVEARFCKTSDYAYAMGARRSAYSESVGNSCWWLRSLGIYRNYAAFVESNGQVNYSGYQVNDISSYAVRPAMWVSLKSSGISYAGNVSSDGTSREPGSISCEAPYVVAKTSSQTFNLNASALGGAKLSYKSSSSKVKVSSDGKVTVPANYLGTPTITITAAQTAGYTKATKKVSVKVRPKQMVISSAYSPGKNKVKFTWTRPYIRSGFQWQIIKDGGDWDKASKRSASSSSSSMTYYSKTNLKSGSSYQVRLRVYKTYNGTKYYGKWSEPKTVTVK